MTQQLPPSVENAIVTPLKTTTYFSSIPKKIKQSKTPVIAGIDEAGRGPVLGPMVYGISYCSLEYQENYLKPNFEFDDSKKLTDLIRQELFSKIWLNEGINCIDEVGYGTTSISACDISSNMLKFPNSFNLNEQAHITTINLIQGLIDMDIQIEHVYIDTVGPPIAYQRKLQEIFPNFKITVAKKADSLYYIVSVASVVAKVTRDLILQNIVGSAGSFGKIGSGYPSDPRTVAWLKNYGNNFKLFCWPKEVTRFSWGTCQQLIARDNAGDNYLPISWEEDYIDNKSRSRKRKLPTGTGKIDLFTTATTAVKDSNVRIISLDDWYK
ncbi:related to Ribonuclease H2 subunit A [Saccharomycodes ludwigii]|uniref:Ribonuclease n=1 Tax=Saccharomycodes ludwigii TaxID=36035 RepID=A0A376B4H2_9ASCO|nr:related to Ribonuclease H2 subunit A [Saccharomycodes ludwigii]